MGLNRIIHVWDEWFLEVVHYSHESYFWYKMCVWVITLLWVFLNDNDDLLVISGVALFFFFFLWPTVLAFSREAWCDCLQVDWVADHLTRSQVYFLGPLSLPWFSHCCLNRCKVSGPEVKFLLINKTTEVPAFKSPRYKLPFPLAEFSWTQTWTIWESSLKSKCSLFHSIWKTILHWDKTKN